MLIKTYYKPTQPNVAILQHSLTKNAQVMWILTLLPSDSSCQTAPVVTGIQGVFSLCIMMVVYYQSVVITSTKPLISLLSKLRITSVWTHPYLYWHQNPKHVLTSDLGNCYLILMSNVFWHELCYNNDTMVIF